MTGAPLRLSRDERQLLHAVCFFSASVTRDDHSSLLIARMREIAPVLPPRQETAKLVEAAEALCASYGEGRVPGDGRAWARAGMMADHVALQFHWQGFCHLSGDS